MVEKTRLTKEQSNEQVIAVKAIAELIPKIREQIMHMHSKSIITAFNSSVSNISKKCGLYAKEKEELTDEEKRIAKEAAQKAIIEFRSKKENAAPIESPSGTDEPIPEISENTIPEEMKHESKKKNRR